MISEMHIDKQTTLCYSFPCIWDRILADLLILFLAWAVVLCGRTSILVRCPNLSPLFLALTKTAGCVLKIPILELANHRSRLDSSSFFSITSMLFSRQGAKQPRTTPVESKASTLFAVTTGVGTHGLSLSLLKSQD